MGCNAGGTVVGGTCSSVDTNPASSYIVVNGTAPSGDGSQWICKVTNIDVNAHNIVYGSVCSYPVGAQGALMGKPKPLPQSGTPSAPGIKTGYTITRIVEGQ